MAAERQVPCGNGEAAVWSTPLTSGHSALVLAGGGIFLTAADGESLLTICLRRRDGAVLWRPVAPRSREPRINRLIPRPRAQPATGQRLRVLPGLRAAALRRGRLPLAAAGGSWNPAHWIPLGGIGAPLALRSRCVGRPTEAMILGSIQRLCDPEA